MRIPFIAGNWKMYKTVAETVKYVKEFRALVKDLDGVEIVRRAAVHRAARRREAARNSNVGIAAQDLLLGARGRVHRRGQRADDPRGRRRVRHRRPLRAAHAVRRDRRDREPQDRRGVRRRADADCLHRRDARPARAERNVRRARSADQAGARRPDGATRSGSS